jgi:polyisoprenoid-binding protein YceI
MVKSGALNSAAVQMLLTEANLAGDWVLDPSRSTVELRTRHTWGLLPLKGIFGEVSGLGTVSPAGEVSGTIVVAAASIDTRSTMRDRDLRSPRFFDVGNHPHITFTLEKVVTSSDAVTASGMLTVRDRARPLAFPVHASMPADGELVLDAEIHIDRAEFGLTFSFFGMASLKNTIVVHAGFTRR